MNKVLLSKWWKTPSAKAAMRRVEDARREKFAAMKMKLAEKKAALAAEVNSWEVIQ